MKKDATTTRRDFIRKSSLGLGAGMAGLSLPQQQRGQKASRLPREVCVASVDLVGLWPDKTSESRITRVLARMDDIAGLQPDVVCLPELFDTMWVDDARPLAEIAEDESTPGPVTSRIAMFAKKHACYVVCPLVTKNSGNFFNSSLLLDRQGKIAGVYHKIHPVKTEILPDQAFKGGGVKAGALHQPVIDTDFGKVGMQICYDANWNDGWESLKRQGAEIVFFPSAFPGGRMLNYYALRNDYYIVSSTGGDARVIDKSGNDLDASSEFVRYAWRIINLEKVTLTTWPTRDHLPDIFRKYGDRLEVRVYPQTDVITIESRDPGLKVADVVKEFEIAPYFDQLKKEIEVQEKYRPPVRKG